MLYIVMAREAIYTEWAAYVYASENKARAKLYALRAAEYDCIMLCRVNRFAFEEAAIDAAIEQRALAKRAELYHGR